MKNQCPLSLCVTGAGGVEVLCLEKRPLPSLAPEEVLVRVRAAGINRADILQRRGFYPAPKGSPADILGLEFSGVVEQAPADSRWSQGDRVMGLLGGGAQAEQVIIHQAELLPIPEGLSFEDAAAIPEAFLTAFDALILNAKLHLGERVFISAVGSGVGTAALQLAKSVGALTFGSSRTPSKLEKATALGLDHPLLISPEENLVRRVRKLTLNKGVHVVLDFLGGGALDDHTALLARRGRMVTLGLLQGRRGSLDLARVLSKRLLLTGSTLRSQTHDERVALRRAFENQVLPLFSRGLVQPVVQQILPFTDAALAHHLIEENKTFGKIILSWSP